MLDVLLYRLCLLPPLFAHGWRFPDERWCQYIHLCTHVCMYMYILYATPNHMTLSPMHSQVVGKTCRHAAVQLDADVLRVISWAMHGLRGVCKLLHLCGDDGSCFDSVPSFRTLHSGADRSVRPWSQPSLNVSYVQCSSFVFLDFVGGGVLACCCG